MRMLANLDSSDAKYGTMARMKGMLAVANSVEFMPL